MMEIFLPLLAALIGAVGFSLLFGLTRFRVILFASLGGVLSYAAFLGLSALGLDAFASSIAASAFASLYSEIFARILKTPSTCLVLPSVIPMIPGGPLFYTMSSAVAKDWTAVRENGLLTLEFALGIAIGVSLISSIFLVYARVLHARHKRLREAAASAALQEACPDSAAENAAPAAISCQLGNPWTEVTIEDLETRFGILISVPDDASGPVFRYCGALGMGEVQYRIRDIRYTARVQHADSLDDITGIYCDWTTSETVESFAPVPGRQMRYSGDAETYAAVLRLNGGLLSSLSATAEAAVEIPDLTGMILQILKSE